MSIAQFDGVSQAPKSGQNGASLGTIARYASTASERHSAKDTQSIPLWGSASVRRFFLQAAAREILPRERVAICLRSLIPGPTSSVDVLYSPVAALGHYGGLQVCGSVWLCPVCSAKITERRRIDLADLMARFGSQFPAGRVALVTFTLSHRKTDNLRDVFKALKDARRLLVSGREAAVFSERHHILSMVRSLEVTYGVNGWHPHLHVLYFFDAEPAIFEFEHEIKARWSKFVAKVGKMASYQHGCDVRITTQDIIDYIAKWGKEPKWKIEHEMTKSPSKMGKYNGLTPLQILYEYAMTNDKQMKSLWLQYGVTFKGERQMYIAPKFRLLLGMVKEKDDKELVESQDEISVLLARLNSVEWRRILANDARADLLEVAASGDAAKVQEFLESFGIIGMPFINEDEGV